MISLSIYFSHNLETKEEFVEVYWQLFKLSPSEEVTNITCTNNTCYNDTVYMKGYLNFMKEETGVLFLGDDEPTSFCLDIDNDQVFCELLEGPFEEGDIFFVDSYGFTIMAFHEDYYPIFQYPRVTEQSTFNVSVNIKSSYKDQKQLDMLVFVNTAPLENRTITMNPDEEITETFEIKLESEGLNKVKIVFSVDKEDGWIDFSTNYSSDGLYTPPLLLE